MPAMNLRLHLIALLLILTGADVVTDSHFLA